MTLLLTEISKIGIAMVADTAYTTPGSGEVRYAPKVFPVPHLKAVMGVWGMLPAGPEVWARGIVEASCGNCRTIEQFALEVQKDLRERLSHVKPTKSLQSTVGIHIAGYTDSGYPTMWHVHNGISQALEAQKRMGLIGEVSIDPHFINANNDLPASLIERNWTARPGGGIAGPSYYQIRNGDYYLLAWFQSMVSPLLATLDPLQNPAGLTTNRGSLHLPAGSTPMDRARFLGWQIQAIASLYRYSNVAALLGADAPHIGGDLEGIAFGRDETPSEPVVVVESP